MLKFTSLIGFFPKAINFNWLTGPIFDKELRTSSRKKRNYILRSAYLALLTVFVVLVWASMVRFQAGSAYQISRMSEAGLAVITTIIVFQFIATQFIAVIMLSNAISDEIYNRTLGVLMTTPVNSFQIVMGKLFSKLLQLILLLAVSLPLLAVVRVFGGVPWNYVLSSLCITLTAVIFAGSLSLFFSVKGRRAYAVIIKTFFALGALYLFIPWILVMLFIFLLSSGSGPPNTLLSILMLPNPIAAMQLNSMAMMSARMTGAGMPFFSWPLHCMVMLGASALLLAWSCQETKEKTKATVTQNSPTARGLRCYQASKGLTCSLERTQGADNPGRRQEKYHRPCNYYNRSFNHLRYKHKE